MSAKKPSALTAVEANRVRNVVSSFGHLPAGSTAIKGVLSGGYFNRSYLVQIAHRLFVLRRYDLNETYDTITYEHKLLARLPDTLHEATLPKPLPTPSGDTLVHNDGKFYALFPYIQGRQFGFGSPELLRQAGRTLARYHNAVWSYTPGQRQGYGEITSLDWVARNVGDVSSVLNLTASLRVSNERERNVQDSVGFLESEYVMIRSKIHQSQYSMTPHLVIHNDFGPQNVVINGRSIVGLFDFDLVAWDSRAYDLATAIMWFAEDANLQACYPVSMGDRTWMLNPKRASMFMSGYAEFIDNPLSEIEVDLLPCLLRTFWLWLAIWYLDLRLGGKDWYPEELSGLLNAMRWFQGYADEFSNFVLSHNFGY